MIISVSRRTDIPAFYAEWFYNRLRAGYVLVRNPMNVYSGSGGCFCILDEKSTAADEAP